MAKHNAAFTAVIDIIMCSSESDKSLMIDIARFRTFFATFLFARWGIATF